MADLTADFQSQSFPANWSYQWNAQGDIGSAVNYTDLLPGTDANGDVWSADGALPGVSRGAGSLQLRKTNHKRYLMAHPGCEKGVKSKPGLPKYLIVAYAVPQVGQYSIAKCEIKSMDKASTGLEYLVYVDDNKIFSGEVPGGESKIITGELGKLSPGQKVYLCIGPGASGNNDATYLAFLIAADAR